MRDNPLLDPLLRDSNDLRCLIFPGHDQLLEHDPGERAKAEKSRLWLDVKSVIDAASGVVFIGYSLPTYDSEATQILKRACNGKAVVVCNPSEDVVARFRDIFERPDIIPELHKFEESRFAAEHVL